MPSSSTVGRRKSQWRSAEHGKETSSTAQAAWVHRGNPFLFALGLALVAISTTGLLLTLSIAFSRYVYGHGPRLLPLQETRMPTPIPCHSHNDYWREEPLMSALRAGCIGVEADVWEYGDELYIGHERGVLTPERTLSSLYIDPLVRKLEDISQRRAPGDPGPGVYNTDPGQTLVLLVDLKSDPETEWPLLLEKLSPLRQRGWLSYVEGTTVYPRPVTVVATGNARIEEVARNESFRDVFFDAPLASLDDGAYGPFNSYYASASFRKSIGRVPPDGLQPSQLIDVRRHARMAHDRGLKARYWGLPAWPLDLRNRVWDVLLSEGIDFLNVDDLESVRSAYAPGD